jgi:hypothetical protein
MNMQLVKHTASLLAIFALSGATATAAQASTTHFASPTGGGDCSTAVQACTLTQALVGLTPDDVVSLAGGSYDMKSVTVPGGVTWVATDPSAARPELDTSATGATPVMAIPATVTPTYLNHIAINDTRPAANQAPAIALGSGGSIAFFDVSIDTSAGPCLDAPAPALIDVDLSTMKGQAQRSCLALPEASHVSRSSISTAGLSVGTPPPALSTSGVVEDSTITGGLGLFDPTAVARRVTSIGFRAIEGEGTVVDSLAISKASTGAAISANDELGGTLTAINDTAINTNPAPTAAALQSARTSSPTQTVTSNRLVVSNTIARASVDVAAEPAGACALGASCRSGLVAVDHSNFVTTSGGALITLGAGNQSADPQFVNAATGDYHLLPGSPAIDAGIPAPAAAPSDLDGAARAQGTAPDLGAYETPGPAAVTSNAGTGAGAGTVTASESAPVVGRLHLSRATVRIGRHRATTILSATVSEAATLTIRVQRVHGRHDTTLAGTLRRTMATAGTFKLSVGSHVGSRKLTVGRYRFAVTATDVAGRRSAERVVSFVVSSR